MTAPATDIQVTKQTSTTEPQAIPETDPFAAQREQVRQAALQEAAAAYNPALQDAERRALESARRLAELEARTAQTQKKSDSDPTQFLANPQSEVRQIVKQELVEAVAPLNQFVAQFQNQNNYQQIKNQLRVNPQMSAIMPQVETYLDQEYASLNPLNPGAVAALAMMIFGQIQGGFRPPLISSTVSVGRPLPNPSFAPSPPKAPETRAPQAIELTEQQRKVARLNGLTDAQYMEWMNSSGIITEDRKIGVPT